MYDDLTPIQAKTVHDTTQHMNSVNRDLKLDAKRAVRIAFGLPAEKEQEHD